jgi:predicted HTH domain antitoxin
MRDTTFEIHVPANLLAFGFDRDQIERRLNEWLTLSLFTEGRVSSGKAAKLLQISRIEFLELLRKRGIAYIDYSPAELIEEFDAVNVMKIDAMP